MKYIGITLIALSLAGCGTRPAVVSRSIQDVEVYEVRTEDGGTFECFSLKQGFGDDSWGGIHCWGKTE